MRIHALLSPTMRSIAVLVVLLLPTSTIASMTIEEERELGAKLAIEIQQTVNMVNDPLIKEYVNKVGRRLLNEAHDQRFDYSFYVVKEHEPNAFAIPGGHIFVSSGLINLVDTEDELAGVIGHEIAHGVLRHIDKAMARAKRLSLATLAAIIAGAFLAQDARGAAALGTSAMAMAQSLLLKYTRDNEVEADQKGMKYMIDAGYDPRAMVVFLKKIYRWQRFTSPEIPTYLSTHPGIADRITYLSDTFMTTPKSLTPHPCACGDLKKIQIKLFLQARGGAEGITKFSSLLREKPGDVNTLYGLGTSYAIVGRNKKAIYYLSEALKVFPQDEYILRELGIAYFQAQEIDKALEALLTASHAFPHDTIILYYLAQGYEEKGQWDDALSFYHQILKRDAARVDLYYNLGVVYDKKGALGPAHEYFGLYFKKRGQLETALFHFKKALEYTQEWEKKRYLKKLIEECGG